METADLTWIPTRSVMGPINYRPLKLLGSPGLIVEPPKHRTSIARIRLATAAQLRVVDKLLDPREMELADAAYEGTRLADDPRYGKPCGNAQLAKTLAVYDRADPAAARVIIVARSDFEGTSPKLFWPEILIYSLPGPELNRDQANLERDQAVIEKDQARRELDMLKAEHQQEQRVRENAENCEQLKSELERIQRRQRELDMQKGARPKERTGAGSRPESRMEVDEAPRSMGRFNLDRAAQEHMNEGLEVWIPTESTSSLHGLESQPIRPLMDVALPRYTPSSFPSSSQVSGSSSRLKELNERLQLRNRESPARVELPPTWREQPIRSVVISSY